MKNKKLTVALLVFYLLALTWIILFKMSFNLPHFRGLNLIPFAESVIVNGHLYLSEIINNILAFAPFGLFIAMLTPQWPLWQKIIPIAGTSLAFEMLQYIFALGASDITDLIGNTLGGLIGIGLYCLLLKLFKNQVKLNKFLTIFLLVAAIAMAALVTLLITTNL